KVLAGLDLVEVLAGPDGQVRVAHVARPVVPVTSHIFDRDLGECGITGHQRLLLEATCGQSTRPGHANWNYRCRDLRRARSTFKRRLSGLVARMSWPAERRGRAREYRTPL